MNMQEIVGLSGEELEKLFEAVEHDKYNPHCCTNCKSPNIIKTLAQVKTCDYSSIHITHCKDCNNKTYKLI